MKFSIAFNLVSKFVSCPVAATDIAGTGFILTIPDADEMAVVVEGDARVTRILLLAVVIGVVDDDPRIGHTPHH